MKITIIDVGSASIKHYIFDVNGSDKNLVHYKRYSDANLGESEVISKETIARNIKILTECVKVNKENGVEKMEILGTDILRRAENASAFIFEVRKLTGKEIKVVSHEDEAQYLYEGFINIIPNDFSFGALNIGGGSTEVVVGNNSSLVAQHKIPFGVKKIRDRFSSVSEQGSVDWPLLDKYLQEQINVNQEVQTVFVTGVLDFINQVGPHLGFEFEKNDIANHPISFSIDKYINFTKVLRETDINHLKSIYTKDPSFADNFAIGQSVYVAIASKMGAKIIIPSNNDMTDGVLYRLLKNS